MAKVFGALFFDKLRGIVSFIVLVIIAVLLAKDHFFPKPVKLDERTTETFVTAADVMRKAAAAMEQTAQDNIQFRQSMQNELSVQAELRKTNYATLYEQYGIGSLPSPANSTVSGFTYGLQQQPDSERGRPVPPGKDHPGGIQQLQHPTPHSGEAAGGSNTRASGGSSDAPSEQGGGVGKLPRSQ